MQTKQWLLVAVSSATSAMLTLLTVSLFITPKYSLGLVEAACNGDCTNADAIQIAAQLGRLDIVSLCLGLLGIAIAFGGIITFFAIKEKASIEAKRAAEDATNR